MDAAEGLEVGFSRNIITPPKDVALAGYFNPRFNDGVLDDLQVRVVLFRQGDAIMGIAMLDLLEATCWLCDSVREELRELGKTYAENLIIAATHTHTAPEPRQARDETHQFALDLVVQQTVSAILSAEKRLAPAQISSNTLAEANTLAYNRRFWMQDGTVVTNPGKKNTDIVRPESTVDSDISVVKICSATGKLTGLLVNVTNHTDTIGGNEVSADWPGFLERRIQNGVGWQVPVITLVGAAGNINHFDVTEDGGQTSYDEARTIGEAYADIVLASLEDTTPVPNARLGIGKQTFPLQKRAITPEEHREAEAVVASGAEDTGVFTSEDLARGTPAVMRYFARQLLNYAENEAGSVVNFDVSAIRLGPELAIVSMPGEPFTEIGLSVKEQSPFAETLVVTNANGYAGYICWDDSHKRGGYEPLPVEHGGAAPGMHRLLIQTALEALQGCHGSPAS